MIDFPDFRDTAPTIVGGEIDLGKAAAEGALSAGPRWRVGGLPPETLARVLAAMRAGLAQDMRLATLAAIAGLSTYHFARAFKQSTGLPPHQYLLRLRLMHAQELLRRSRMPVREIAKRVGHADTAHFTKLFKRTIGLTPTAYRRRFREWPEPTA